MITWIKNLFKTDTNYPQQVLSNKQKALVEMIDHHLAANCIDASSASIAGTVMVVKTTEIPLNLQPLGVAFIMNHLRKSIQTSGYYYIPRSVALISEADGNWIFYYGVRTPNGIYDEEFCKLFLDALNRTNNAR